MEHVENAPVFVVGSGRSGTTILDRCIGEHPDFSSFPFEPQVFSDPEMKNGLFILSSRTDVTQEQLNKVAGYLGRRFKFETARSGTQGFYQWIDKSSFQETLQTFKENVLKTPESSVRDLLHDLYEPLLKKGGAKKWVDGGPMNSRLIPEISKIYPNAKFVHIIRDGRDVAKSFVRLGWSGGSFNMAAQFWMNQVVTAKILGRKYASDRYHEVQFEELIENPEKVMKEVSGFLEVPYVDNMSKRVSYKRSKQFSEIHTDEQTQYVNDLMTCLDI